VGLIPVFVISLERTPERLATMAKQLDALHVPFTWIKAIDGQHLSEQDLRRIMPRPNHLMLRYPLSAGQIASTASHRLTIERIWESGADFACVMEDDGQLDSTFPEFLDRDWLATLPPFDVLKLASDWAGRRDDLAVSIASRSTRQVCVPLHPSYSARCYVLSRRGAANALRRLRVIDDTTDFMIFRRPMTSMRFLDVRPIVVGLTGAETTQRNWGRDAPAPWWRPILSWAPHRLVLMDRKVRRYLAFARALGAGGFRQLEIIPLEARRSAAASREAARSLPAA
jgi:GR25 family glycosyltransferase involved in LPS biosynthesis